MLARTTMVAPYPGEDLSLQELLSAFSYKLKEVSTDPDKYVTQVPRRRTRCSQLAVFVN